MKNLHPAYELDNEGEYEPQLKKVGWLRFSDEELTIDELYMDSSGAETVYFLGGLGSTGTATASGPADAFAKTQMTASTHRGYILSLNFVLQTALKAMDASLKTSSYVVSRFLGENAVKVPEIALRPFDANKKGDETRKSTTMRYKDAFVVIKSDALFIYSNDRKLECIDVLNLREYQIGLHSNSLQDHEIYHRYTPLRLWHKHTQENFGMTNIYCLSGSDKEDWYFLLRRATTLQYSEVPDTITDQAQVPQIYKESMKKLGNSLGLGNLSTSNIDTATVWINALLGRIFVGFHSNPLIKTYLIEKLSRRSGGRSFGTSFLSDIEITDIDVG
ncbi:hypothetical protein BC830DRAFT_217230, partial [Chytriomyces sp. MP71]